MESLQNKIWITRKSRIEASERLLRNDFHSHIIINLYATLLVIISVYDLYSTKIDLSLLAVIGSILVLTTSIFISSKNFRERSNFLKTCYIKLDKLQTKINSLTDSEKESRILEISEEYNDILLNSENHLPVDFTKIKLSIPKQNREKSTKISTTELISFYIYSFLRISCLIILYFLPAIITFLYILNASTGI